MGKTETSWQWQIFETSEVEQDVHHQYHLYKITLWWRDLT